MSSLYITCGWYDAYVSCNSFHDIGSNCSSYSNLCAGEYNFNIQATSAKCSKVEGEKNYSFTVGSNLEFSKAGMEVECSTGKYTIMTTEPATLRCRIDSGNWQTCKSTNPYSEYTPCGKLYAKTGQLPMWERLFSHSRPLFCFLFTYFRGIDSYTKRKQETGVALENYENLLKLNSS